ncbi:TonB-dependent receptor [Comamonas endophytica]|uniref:TonB-dependent receptor n=1 Tax=Comamonas endophytica TaxID=2949090 RepID=A0ABY6GBD1_9BURK|nr:MULTISPECIES: TonB-dependent receptor [unclassified Acidovorax]MCD2513990.1 TonB-dependent receptor [Acidovorax sp. D4N7]UYG52020.1 TonB-dependent receptor [Acidovorax sp. 5MLIR]
MSCRPALLSLLAWATLAGPAAHAAGEDPTTLADVFVTATARPEGRLRIAATTQTIDRADIERSSARSVTDLLAEHAVGFLSEWTAAQTSMNLRGAATDGQGRDYRGQVLVLLNGRRAGTANLSKLSLSDVERIEIVRGPGSVVYGSQNMGGVINIILRTGASGGGNRASVVGGGSGLWRADTQISGASERWDWYVGANAGGRDDYDSGRGGGEMRNTSYKRRGASGALGWQLADLHRVELQLRTDGIYNAGFRGSGANIFSRDNRYNQSADLRYEGALPGGRVSWLAHAYAFTDVDEFNWASPVIRSGTSAVPGTARDYNHRQLDATGLRLQPRLRLSDSNDLLLGFDYEKNRLRSDRERNAMPGGPAGQVAPYDTNQTEHTHALYLEDAQTFFGDRLTLRAGLRRTWGETRFDQTPNVPLAVTTARDYGKTTWSTGAVWKVSDSWALRAGASTGFRAPTASELSADFTAVGGGRSFGNPNLKPESSRQLEVGTTLRQGSLTVDAALFQNTISDRIITVSRGPATNTSDYANNAADIVARGLELSARSEIGRLASGPVLSVFGNSYYHFEMKDKGAAASANTDRVQRMYQYEAAVGLRLARGMDRNPGDWSAQLTALLRGPMWYDTEENLLIPQGEPSSTFIHRKGAFTVWNLRGEYRVSRGMKLFAGINNVFDLNRHPIFIALDKRPCIANPIFQNGGCGTSMPGREWLIGLQADF